MLPCSHWLDAPWAELGHNGRMSEAISVDQETMHGLAVFRGTRVPVQTLFEYLEGGETLEDFLEGFPTVSRALALDALEEAKRLLLGRVLRRGPRLALIVCLTTLFTNFAATTMTFTTVLPAIFCRASSSASSAAVPVSIAESAILRRSRFIADAESAA